MRVAVYSFERYDATCLIPALSECVGKDNVKLVPVRLVSLCVHIYISISRVLVLLLDLGSQVGGIKNIRVGLRQSVSTLGRRPPPFYFVEPGCNTEGE